MPGFKLVEEFSHRPDPALPNVPQALADTFCRFGLSSGIEEPLIAQHPAQWPRPFR